MCVQVLVTSTSEQTAIKNWAGISVLVPKDFVSVFAMFQHLRPSLPAGSHNSIT